MKKIRMTNGSKVYLSKEAMQRLGEREKKILNLRFFEGKTQMEVAQEIGISQAQVSRLEKAALKHMRKFI
jgi:RNA polymerase sporulation-specific sigma factor